MATIPIGGIHISVTGNSADFRAAIKSARVEIAKLKASWAQMKAAGRAAALGFAAVAGGAALMGKSLADGVDNLGKLSASLRTSVKDLQALEQAAMLQGVAWKQVEKGIINLRNVLGEISSNVAYKTQTDAWKSIGVAIEDVIDLNAADQIRIIGKAIKDSVPPAEQLSVAAELVGKKAALGFLRMSDEVAAAQNRLDEFGLALSDHATDNVEAANDALALLGNAFQNVGRQLLADAAPGIKLWADGVMESLRPGGELREVITDITDAFRRVMGVIGEFVSVAGPFVNETTLMGAAIFLVSKRAIEMGAALKGAGAAIMSLNAMGATASINGLAGAVKVAGTALGGALGLGAMIALAVSAFREFNSEAPVSRDVTKELKPHIDAATASYEALEKAITGAGVAQTNFVAGLRESSDAMLAHAEDVLNTKRGSLMMENADDHSRLSQLEDENARLFDALNPFDEEGNRIDDGLRPAIRKRYQVMFEENRKEAKKLRDKLSKVYAPIAEAEAELAQIRHERSMLGVTPSTPPGAGTGTPGGIPEGMADFVHNENLRMAAQARGAGSTGDPLDPFGGQHQTWSQGTGMTEEIEELKTATEEAEVTIRAFGGDGELFDPATRSITKFRDEQELAKQNAKAFGEGIKSSIGSSIDGMIDGTMKLSGLFKNLLKDMAKMAVKWAIFGGPTGGAGGGIFGSIFGFASGGHVNRDGLYRVGEQGEELVALPGGSRVYNNRDSRRMTRGGGGMNIAITLSASNEDALRNQIQRSLNAAIPQMMEMNRAAYIADVSRPSDTRIATRSV